MNHISGFQYDIALSFAGEDREIVSDIATLLKADGIKVFYDEFIKSELWGENLHDYLADVYSKQACYCIVFISDSYVKKVWTKHELKNAQARALRQSEPYILPVKLDDTYIPSIPETTGYIDLRNTTIKDFVNLIKKKLSKVSKQLSSSDNDFFGQPDKLCSALDSQALQTKGWKPSNAFPGEFICMTTLVSFGLPGSNGMENNIAYYVNGTQADRANDIRVKININNPSERAQAFDRLSMATKTLFKAIAEPVPIALSEALAAEKPISLDTTFGKVELIHEPGIIDSFKIVLTDKRFLASKQAAKVMFADDFEACRSAVAKAAGYGVSSIIGDGQPINEPDHRSFLLNGKNNDIFFCEIYPGRKYKIKAALGSKFPFKYIAEGVL